MTKPKNEMATLEQFTVGGNLDINDVLSVVTSKAEERYSAEIDRCRTEIAELEDTNAKLRIEINRMVAKEAVEPHNESIKALRSAIKVFGGTVSITATRSNILPTNDKDDLTATVTITVGKNRYTEFQTSAKPSKELQAKTKSFESNVEKIKTINNEAVSWKRKLNNIPMLERRYRAKIASIKLSNSEDGQKLLSVLTDDLEDSILSLPAC